MHNTEEGTMWIRVDVATPDGRKARRAARAIADREVPQVDAHEPRVVLGTLVMIWIKTRIQAPDGVLAGYDAEDLADMAGCSAPEIEALIEAGWIDRRPDGLEIHEWMEHNGDHLREAKRKRDSRASKGSIASSDGASGPAVNSSVTSVTSVTSRRADRRGKTRTGDGCPPDVRGREEGDTARDLETGPPGAVPGPDTKAHVGAQDARTALFSRAGVPEEQWDAVDAFCGLSAGDLSPEAQAQRGSIAQMAPEDRDALLEPLGEVHRQRIVDLLSAGGEGSKTGATPGDIAIETKQPKAQRVHVGAIAEMSKSLGKAGQATTIRLATWLFNRGITHSGLLERFVRHYVTHAAGIREPFAYYNPGRDGFEFIRNRCAADAATEEHQALLAAERRWLQGASAD